MPGATDSYGPTVGILGGLGPLAGAAFYRTLLEMTVADDDTEHFRAVLISDPTIPSRREHLLHGGPSPLPGLLSITAELCSLGASVITVPSSTAHAYVPQLAASTNVPFVNALAEVADTIRDRRVRRPGLLVSNATAELRLLDPFFDDVVAPIYPDELTQRLVDEIIDAVKAGQEPASSSRLQAKVADLVSAECWNGIDSFLLGCTETSLLDLPTFTCLPLISVMDTLAAATVRDLSRQRERAASTRSSGP